MSIRITAVRPSGSHVWRKTTAGEVWKDKRRRGQAAAWFVAGRRKAIAATTEGGLS